MQQIEQVLGGDVASGGGGERAAADTSTVATNAILEGKGARVGLVTTEGSRQVLQIARSSVPGGLAGWIIWPKPEPLAALEHTVEVPGAVWVAEQSGHRDLLTFNMGGTSTDIALVQNLGPRVGRETKVGDLTVRDGAILANHGVSRDLLISRMGGSP